MTFIPPDLPIWAFWLLVCVSFLAAAMTAALSLGGGLLLIGVMSLVMPAAAIVPVHGVLLLGSNTGRAAVLHRFIDRKIVVSFATGAIFGAIVGGLIVTNLPTGMLRLFIAGFILFTQWGPKISLPTGRQAVRITGFFSVILSLFVGATGPFITSLLAAIPRFERRQLIGTAAGCLTVQHGLKVGVFGLGGFQFVPWAGLIIVALLAGFAGTLMGTTLLGRMPEALFRRILKAVLTVMALLIAILTILE